MATLTRTSANMIIVVLMTAAIMDCAWAQPDGTVHQYLSREEALLEVFPSSVTYVVETITLSDAQIREAEAELYRKIGERTVEVTLCYDAEDRLLGYAVISDEQGKYRPITFIVGIEPHFKVNKVAIMVYREDRGGEVRMPRFLYQYRGKSIDDPLRVNRDIVNISGATISARAITDGVKKVLYLVTQRFADHPPPLVPSGKPLERAEQ